MEVEILGTPISFQNKTAYQIVARDISWRKQPERELEAIARLAGAPRTAETKDEVLPVIVEQVMDILNVEGASLLLLDPDSDSLIVEETGGIVKGTGMVNLPQGQGVSWQVLKTGQPYVTEDHITDSRFVIPGALGEEALSVAAVPLFFQEKVIGVLWISRRKDQGTFTNVEMNVFRAISDITASALHRSQLFDEVKLRANRLAALRQIDLAITSSLDLNVTLGVCLDQVATQLEIDAACVLLLNEHTQMLEYESGKGFQTTAIERSQVRLGMGQAGHASLTRRRMIVPDLSEIGTESLRTNIVDSEGFVFYAAQPLITKGEVVGVLEIFHRSTRTLDDEQMKFLEALAGQVAIAIDNARLFSDLQRSNMELVVAYDSTLDGWSRALDLRDHETEGHTQRVTEMAEQLARAMGITGERLANLRRGALLHDIGKMGVPDKILHKPGPLTEEEWEIMRKHPVYAYQLLSPIDFLQPALDIPYCHHEKWDGSGYPRGLSGESIPLAARIFAVVDVWDALRSDRPYRDAWQEQKVLAHIREQSGTHFDPQVVEAFPASRGEPGGAG